MSYSSKSSLYTDVTWSGKTLNFSISRFFTAIKTGLGAGPAFSAHTFPKDQPVNPLLTWDQLRDQFNVIDQENRQAKEKSQLRFLKETISSVACVQSVIPPVPVAQQLRVFSPVTPSKPKRPESDFLRPLDHRIVQDFQKDFYRVPPPVYIKIPQETRHVHDDDTDQLIRMPLKKLKKIPPWEKYSKTTSCYDRNFFSIYEDLEKRVITFHTNYHEVRTNFPTLCEFVRTKQLKSKVFLRQCRQTLEQTQILRKHLGQIYIQIYNNRNKSNAEEFFLLVVARHNYTQLTNAFTYLKRSSDMCEEGLTEGTNSLARMKYAFAFGEEVFKGFQLAHGAFVRNVCLLEKYFWKLWWHFDIIQREFYGKDITEAYERHLEVFQRSISEIGKGKKIISSLESKLRGLFLLLQQTECIKKEVLAARSIANGNSHVYLRF